MMLTDVIKNEAYLTLVIDHELLEDVGDPKIHEKTQVFKPFFGREGDIIDPWGETESQCYDKCANKLKKVFEYNFENNIRSLSKD